MPSSSEKGSSNVRVPDELWVVIDPSDNDSVYSALYEEACHEHINEAIGEDIDGAGSWVVRRYVLAHEPGADLDAGVVKQSLTTELPPFPWQPIETAPKGGKWVLLWWPAVTDDTMVICPVCTSQFRAIPLDVQRQLDFLSAPERGERGTSRLGSSARELPAAETAESADERESTADSPDRRDAAARLHVVEGDIGHEEEASFVPAHEPETAPSPVNARTTEVRRDPCTRNAGESREAGEAAGDGAAQPPSVDLHEVERLLQRAEIGRALAIIQRATGSPETKGASK